MLSKTLAARKAAASEKARPLKKVKVTSNSPTVAQVKTVPRPSSVKKPKANRGPEVIPTAAKGKQRESAPHNVAKNEISQETNVASTSALPSTFKVITGSYEKLLYGLEGTVTIEDSAPSYHLKPIFIFPAHVSSVKAVSASPQGGKWLATGSSDEIIKVWDLRRRKEVGGLMHHEGSITHLEFPSRSHLLSASEDGTLCLFHARDWGVLRSLKGHKGRVNSVAVHPSGKVALSVGKDRTLRMWDLMRGKGSASTKLGKEAEVVKWSTDGSLFVVLSGNTIDLYNTEMKLLHTIIHSSRLHGVKFVGRVIGSGEVLLVAAEDKKLSIYDIPSNEEHIPKIVAEMIGHSNRVKAVEALAIALPEGAGRPSTSLVSTISSDGKVLLYDLAALPESSTEKTQIEPVAEYDTKGSRLTCLTIADGEVGSQADSTGKRKRDDDADNKTDDAAYGSEHEEIEEEEEREEEED